MSKRIKELCKAYVDEFNRLRNEYKDTANNQHDTIQQQDGDINELLVVIGGGVINEQVLSED